MKKILIIVFLLLSSCGCSRYNELNKLAIIKTIGLEFYNNEYTLYADIIDEISENNNIKTYLLIKKNSDVKKLFDDIKIEINKKIHLSHIDLIILSPTLNNNNYNELINFVINNNDFRTDFLVAFSDNIKDLIEKTEYDEIIDTIITNKDKKIANTSFLKLMQNYLNNKSFIAPMITYDNKLTFKYNLKYYNSKIERINNDK